MTSLTFELDGEKALLSVNGGEDKTKLPKDVLQDVCLMVLAQLSERDYSNVTSVRKLCKIIELEKELADESDDESEEEEPVVKTPPKKTPAKAKGKKAAPKAKKQPPPAESSDSDESASESSEESESDS